MVYKDSLDEKKRHFHFGEFLHFQFGTNSKSLGQRTRKHLRLIRRISVQYVAKSNIQTEFALVKMMDIRGER